MNGMRSLVRCAGMLALMVGAGSCGDSTSPETNVQSFITALETVTGSASASFHAGTPPASSGAGPLVSVTGSSAMILGGSSIRTVNSATAFTRVIVAVEGVSGYYELLLPSATTTQQIVLSLAQAVPNQSFTVNYAAGTTAAVGPINAQPVSVLTVGTGDVQVSVSWDTDSDVDLHVVEPGGEEIYYGNSSSTAGGTLDLDSNAACSIDGTNNENITWPTNAPGGTYTVRVDYWDSCGVGSTNYVVTVRVKGRAAQTFSGTLTGLGDQGALGDGITITTFTK